MKPLPASKSFGHEFCPALTAQSRSTGSRQFLPSLTTLKILRVLCSSVFQGFSLQLVALSFKDLAFTNAHGAISHRPESGH